MSELQGILAEFAANEIGWTQVLDRLKSARDTYRLQAAMAEPNDHLDLRGQLRGMERAITLIDECRRSLRQK